MAKIKRIKLNPLLVGRDAPPLIDPQAYRLMLENAQLLAAVEEKNSATSAYISLEPLTKDVVDGATERQERRH